MFAAALWLCVGGLFAAPPAQAAAPPVRTERAGGGGGGGGAHAESGGCAGRLARTLPIAAGEVRVYKTHTQACAVAVARVPGERRGMAVSIQPRGGAAIRDIGRFTRYAGPVTVGAIGRCVYVKGSVGAGSADSGWILC
ncbi:hypothetical protein OG429_14900 [Streptomyces sp. NBC_00190]|uniref:hypothetical protein n=1 Tax=unclassified Streptomyces TaxID=2593676 RepID=UPI002E281729|nr:hypothetical protein [Streptomyces sp. NBC_00190]WSZ40467.1 hypothetical protein OG239_17580 [Streptomyces sp. NBC_00868]